MKRNNILLKAAAFAVTAAVLVQPSAVFAENQKLPDDIVDQMRSMRVEAQTSKLKEIMKWDTRGTEEYTQNVTVRVDETDNWELCRENLGYMVEPGGGEYLLDGTGWKDTMLNDAKKFEPMVCLRYGGTTSNMINWISSMEPIGSRPTKPFASSWTKTTSMTQTFKCDMFEYMKLQFTNNPNSSVMPCVSPYTHTAEDIENLAHFFYDSADTKWGKKRIEVLGREEPVDVYAWELGNEIDYSDTNTQAKFDWYIKVARSFSEAIRKVKPDAMIIACGSTAPWGHPITKTRVREDWCIPVFEGLADIVDGMSFHPYYDGVSPESVFIYMDELKNVMDTIVKEQDIRDENGNLKDPVIVGTEGARWSDPNDSYLGSETVNAAVCNMQWINMIFQQPYVKGNMMIGWIGKVYLWGIWETDGTNFWQAPTGKMLDMYISNLGDRIVKSEWSENVEDESQRQWISLPVIVDDPDNDYQMNRDVASGIHKFSVNVMGKDKNEIVVMLTNKSFDTKVEVDFDLKHNYTLVEETYITAPNGHTYSIDQECADLVEVVTNEKNEKNFSHYTVPANGMVALTLRTTDKLPLLGETASSGGDDSAPDVELTDESFKDISNHWARNEIEFMRQAEVVNGSDEGKFFPEDKITRAEFYSMLARVLKSEDKFSGSVFSDVSPDMWYANSINVSYAEGIITSDKFDGGKIVDFAELVNVIEQVSKNHNAAYVNSGIEADRCDMSGWNIEAISSFNYALNGGYLKKFFENGSFDINAGVSRAEAAVVLYRLSANINN